MLQYLQSSKTFFKKVITIIKLVSTCQSRIQAIWKLNNYIYSWLIRSRPTVIADRWHYNISQDWELLAKSYDNISDEQINEVTLLRLNLHISALGYLKERISHFTKLATKDKNEEEYEDDQESLVSNSKEEIKKKCYKKRKEKAGLPLVLSLFVSLR